MRPLAAPLSSPLPIPLRIRALQVAGAALFVVSLGLGGKAYFVDFDAIAPPGTSPWVPLIANTALFSLFGLHHSLLARTTLKARLRSRVGLDAERAWYVIVASLLYLACTRAWAPLPGTWYALSGPWWWASVGVQAAGVLVTLLAARTLSLRELMGLDPPRQAAGQNGEAALETRGLYRLVRHPIYLGWVLFVVGAPLMTSTRLLFAVLSVAYLVVAVPYEERSLEASFGEAYRAYRTSVRWRIVPGVF